MSLLSMSIQAGVMIAVVTIVRALVINRLPKKTFLALWGIALLRLLIPFSLPSPFSVYSLANHAGLTAPTANAPTLNFSPLVVPSQDVAPAVSQVSFWILIWGVGVALCSLYFLFAYIRCHREFGVSQPVDNNFTTRWLAEHALKRTIVIRQSCRISAPLTYGIFHPVILMPKQTDWTDTKTLRYVLTHEYTHIRRFDAVMKILFTAALCLHWFNPLVWVMFILSNRDIELSCDESVVRSFGETIKSAYALALISMEEQKSALRPFCNSFNKNAIEERIKAIMKMKKITMVAGLAALLLIGGVTTVFATSAMASVTYAATADTESPQAAPKEPTKQELLSLYGVYGISFNENGKMLFNDELVRYFWDGVYLGDGAKSIHYEYLNKEGVIDIHTTRKVINNGDGSIDPFGDLTGIEKYSQKEFDARDLNNFFASGNPTTYAEGNTEGVRGETFAERFSKYKDYGIEYKEQSVGSGVGNVYYNGQMVKLFVDENPKGGVFSYSSKDGGEITVYAVYDTNGNLTRVEKK